jgi:hypothetical protein
MYGLTRAELVSKGVVEEAFAARNRIEGRETSRYDCDPVGRCRGPVGPDTCAGADIAPVHDISDGIAA